MVLDQWHVMTVDISSKPGLMSLKFKELWARVLMHKHDEYSLILRLVVIVLLIPADTSECERIFSLMNNIKTSERSRLGVNLKHLMLWHRMACKQNEDGTLSGKHIACCEVPVGGLRQRGLRQRYQP